MKRENRLNEVMIALLVKLKSGALSIAMDLSARVSNGADRTFHNFLQNRSAKFVEKQTRDSEVAPEQTEMHPADPCELAGRDFRVGSGVTGVTKQRLENRQSWPILYFKVVLY